MPTPLTIAHHADQPIALLPALANRHGCITGATGTGKTITLQVLAEQFSRIGTPVFLVDAKGDLSGLATEGKSSPKLQQRLQEHGLTEPQWQACPTVFWDVFGAQGLPLRATISDMGPLLLARLLDLNDTQAGVLSVVFRVADDKGWLLLDLKDLRAMLQYVSEQASSLRAQYGNVSAASVGAIQRSLLALEDQGAGEFFGEPALDIDDLLQTEAGQGVVNVLAAERLMGAPRLYGTVLLWLLSTLFDRLPEVGDPEQPRLVFFFDEAHLLFRDAPRALQDKVEQVVRLIRSKGVGVYFITQNPLDIPDPVLGQLGNRIQHALRAYTPRDQKAVRTAAETMRANPALDIAAAITELGVGEALISLLDEKGRPGVTQRAWMHPPASQIGPIDDEMRARLVADSDLARVYREAIDRESAYELLQARAEAAATPAAAGKPEATASKTTEVASTKPSPEAESGEAETPAWVQGVSDFLFGSTGPRGGRREGVVQSVARSTARSLGTQLVRGILGSLKGGGRRR